VRKRLLEKLRDGAFEDREIEIIVREKQSSPIIGMMGPDQFDPGMSSFLENLLPEKTHRRRVTVRRARSILLEEETDKLIDNEKLMEQARETSRAGGAKEETFTLTPSAIEELKRLIHNKLVDKLDMSRVGDLEGAAQLINVTRTRPQTLRNGGQTFPGLPPVTASGVPQGSGCVPRTDTGACGDLMVALRYERMIEGALLDAIRGYADSRGFGLLPDGTWLSAPVPGGELQIYGLPVYTNGGVGSDLGAVYAPVTMADL
jgi:hypothetical protein